MPRLYSASGVRRISVWLMLPLLAVCAGSDGPVSPERRDYNGTWLGTTSQGGAISFTVENNGVLTLNVMYLLSGGSCAYSGVESQRNPLRYPDLALPISNDRFTMSEAGQSVSGTFTSSAAASGSGTYAASGCGSRASITWTAAKE